MTDLPTYPNPLDHADALNAAAQDAIRAFAKARADREAVAVAGAKVMFEHVSDENRLETLHLILSDDAPRDVQIILCAPTGLTSETWETLMRVTWSRWCAMETAFINEQPLTTFAPADVVAFNKGLVGLILHVAATLGLAVQVVDGLAWGETTLPI